MAALIYRCYLQRRVLRRNQIFRDCSHPFEKFDDVELFKKFRFRQLDILAITDSSRDDIELANCRGTLTPLLQVIVTIWYYVSGSFQDVCGELTGTDQSTVSWTKTRVTKAVYVSFPTGSKFQHKKKLTKPWQSSSTKMGFPTYLDA